MHDKHWLVYDAALKRELRKIEVGNTTWLDVSPDGRWLAVTVDDRQNVMFSDKQHHGGVKVGHVQTGKLHHTLVIDAPMPERLMFSPDSKTLAVSPGPCITARRAE